MEEIKIQILSDLHLEAPKAYDVFDFEVRAPHLALLGDIGYTAQDELFSFFECQLNRFQVVFFLLGNHEPYHSSWATSKTKVREYEAAVQKRKTNGESVGSFVFLDQTRFDLSRNKTILGCTLHSRIVPEQAERVNFGLNDFYHIEDWSIDDHNEAHEADLSWLNSQVRRIAEVEPWRQITIFTHHCPTLDERTVALCHRKSPISSGFSTDLHNQPCWAESVVSTWAYGHTHFNCDFAADPRKMFGLCVTNVVTISSKPRALMRAR